MSSSPNVTLRYSTLAGEDTPRISLTFRSSHYNSAVLAVSPSPRPLRLLEDTPLMLNQSETSQSHQPKPHLSLVAQFRHTQGPSPPVKLIHPKYYRLLTPDESKRPSLIPSDGGGTTVLKPTSYFPDLRLQKPRLAITGSASRPAPSPAPLSNTAWIPSKSDRKNPVARPAPPSTGYKKPRRPKHSGLPEITNPPPLATFGSNVFGVVAPHGSVFGVGADGKWVSTNSDESLPSGRTGSNNSRKTKEGSGGSNRSTPSCKPSNLGRRWVETRNPMLQDLLSSSISPRKLRLARADERQRKRDRIGAWIISSSDWPPAPESPPTPPPE